MVHVEPSRGSYSADPVPGAKFYIEKPCQRITERPVPHTSFHLMSTFHLTMG